MALPVTVRVTFCIGSGVALVHKMMVPDMAMVGAVAVGVGVGVGVGV